MIGYGSREAAKARRNLDVGAEVLDALCLAVFIKRDMISVILRGFASSRESNYRGLV